MAPKVRPGKFDKLKLLRFGNSSWEFNGDLLTVNGQKISKQNERPHWGSVHQPTST